MSAQNGPRAALADLPDRSVFIDGRWTGSAEADTIEVLNPATEEAIGRVLDTPRDLVDSAMAAAQRAFPGWAALPPAERARYIDALADTMHKHGEELARLASSEIGMPISDARAGQVDLPTRVLRTYAELARTHPWEERDASGSTVVREPAGVVLAITPWNFPVHQIIAKLGPALAAGCTMVLKPAELTPLNALFIAACCDEIGLPPGVFNVVTGYGRTTGEALLATKGYEIVSFTGSLQVGRRIGAIAGESIVRATLELGGKSPAVVLPDADLERAVTTTVRNCFVNAGQKCNAPTRLLVPEGVLTDAVGIAASVAGGYVIGDPLQESTTMGPLVSAEHRRKVLGWVDSAAEGGARILAAGPQDGWERGFFVHPVIVTDVEQSAPIVQEEVFGPVLVVQGYGDQEQAIAMANDTKYGLSAEVWSGDDAVARSVARRLRAGQVRVNGVRTPAPPVSPFGGYKRSGIGRELGPFGLEEFVEVKAILGDPAG